MVSNRITMPEVSSTVDRVEQLVNSISRLSTRQSIQRAMLDKGSALSPTDNWLLRHLADEGPARMSDLASWQSVDRSTMTVQVGRLERAGLVAREPDPHDRRAVVVAVTNAGRTAYERNSAAARALVSTIVAEWAPAERDRFVESLDLFVRDVEAYLSADRARTD